MTGFERNAKVSNPVTVAASSVTLKTGSNRRCELRPSYSFRQRMPMTSKPRMPTVVAMPPTVPERHRDADDRVRRLLPEDVLLERGSATIDPPRAMMMNSRHGTVSATRFGGPSFLGDTIERVAQE